MNRPKKEDYPAWGETYISKVTDDVFDELENQIGSLPELYLQNADKADYAYAPGKWTLREMLGHIIDTERILVYRLNCFARNEQQELPGFEEDDYVTNARFHERSVEDMLEEFVLLRKANLYLFRSFNEEELERIGTMSGGRRANVRAMIFIIAGHINHHMGVIKERYLNVA